MLVRQLISILKYSLITYLNCNILMLRDDNIMKNIKPYKQNGNTCAICCMLMIYEYFNIINKPNKLYEREYYRKYKSKYINGVHYSLVTYQFAKKGLKVKLIHSEKNMFKNNNYFDNKLFNNLMEEYNSYINAALEEGTELENGTIINVNLLKEYLNNDNLIILAGQVNNILHSILLIEYENNKFIVCDPLFKEIQYRTSNEIELFMNTPIGKWCIIISGFN